MPYFHMPKKPWVSDSPKKSGNPTIKQRQHTLLVDVEDKSPKRMAETSAGVIRFEDGTAILPDDQRGRDMAEEYVATRPPKTVAVRDKRLSKYRDPVHRYWFGGWPEMPWKVKDAE